MASSSVLRELSGARRMTTRVLMGLLSAFALALAGFLVWANVGVMQAEPRALAAATDDPAIVVAKDPAAVVMTPASGTSELGLVFIPGAKVVAEAYVSNLSGIVASSGVTVVIVRPTLNLAIVDLRPLTAFTDLAPDIDKWYVGGHSLGGVRACKFATEPEAAGLVLFGSYCATDLSASAIPVLSLGGTEDGLSTLAKIQDAADLLPADAEFVQIDGASHASFGDYGEQSGDRTAIISRDEIRTLLTDELDSFLRSD